MTNAAPGVCIICGEELTRKVGESLRRFARRQTCSAVCFREVWLRERNRLASTPSRKPEPAPVVAEERARKIERRMEIARRMQSKQRDMVP